MPMKAGLPCPAGGQARRDPAGRNACRHDQGAHFRYCRRAGAQRPGTRDDHRLRHSKIDHNCRYPHNYHRGEAVKTSKKTRYCEGRDRREEDQDQRNSRRGMDSGDRDHGSRDPGSKCSAPNHRADEPTSQTAACCHVPPRLRPMAASPLGISSCRPAAIMVIKRTLGVCSGDGIDVDAG